MDIAATVQGFRNVEPLPGLPDAWVWKLGRRFTFALALTADGAHAVQTNFRDTYDPELAVAVLSFARRNSPAVLAAVPFAVLEDFTPPTGSFDVVAAAIPAVHRYHERTDPALNDVTYAVFAGYRCEFSGRETQQEAADRFDRMIDPANINRLPAPFLRMRYDNPKTGSGSIGTDLGLAPVDTLMAELRNLEHAENAYVDFENYVGEQRRAAWTEDGLELRNGDRARPIEMADLLGWTHAFVYEGVDSES